ncbi:MAG TPA: copper-binding protein [Bryobacteraceae bacterium]|nr:copper-binding protein [Bryobacteraceae bacterium]
MRTIKNSITLRGLAALLALACLLSSIALAQGNKKSFTFHGKVTSVDEKTNKLNVDGEKVEGWMDAMVMAYSIDNPAVIKSIKAGDRIEATVYEGDYTLHNVKVVPPQKK